MAVERGTERPRDPLLSFSFVVEIKGIVVGRLQ